jgi:hypothetical protein
VRESIMADSPVAAGARCVGPDDFTLILSPAIRTRRYWLSPFPEWKRLSNSPAPQVFLRGWGGDERSIGLSSSLDCSAARSVDGRCLVKAEAA